MQRNSFCRKRLLFITASFFVFYQTFAQTPRTIPAAYSANIKTNYIRTWEVVAPVVDPGDLTVRPLKDVKQTTAYVDLIGRKLQTVVKEGSLETSTGVRKDIVSPVEFNSFGKEEFQYVSFVSATNDGNLKLDVFQQQAAFMNAQYGGQGENYFYGQTIFEASPLNRVMETYDAGNSWEGTAWKANENDRRGVKMKYWTNTAIDGVRMITVTDISNDWGTYTAASIFGSAALYKNITVDEHGKQVIEFKDKEGLLLLKKVQLTAAADAGGGSGNSGWLCTYYVYDVHKNLRCVVQPRGVELLEANGWNFNALNGDILKEQCFRYEYDYLKRMIRKKIPGTGNGTVTGDVFMIYDSRDRLVMTQDANMRNAHQWLYTKYDNNLNRPVSTGLITDNSNYNNPSFHRNLAATSIDYPNLSNYPGYDELTVTFYDNYNWLGNYSTGLSSSPDNTANGTGNSNFMAAQDINYPYPQPLIKTDYLTGMVTGTRIKVLGTGTYLYTINFYDEKGRVIQMQATNISGGTDITTTQYSWVAQPLVVVNKHQKAGTGAQTTVIVTQLTYDDLGRAVKIEKRQSNTLVNGGAMSAYKTITQNEYDKLGQLKKKSLGNNVGATAPIETMNYEYNIRGWMLGANRDYAKDVNNTNYFGFDLGYDKANNNIIGNQTYASPQYNGNIEGMVWKSKGDGEKRKYDFTYDAANRILRADFGQYTGGTFNQTAGVNYNMKMGDGINVSTAYDPNGNILQMQQWGLKLNTSPQIDNLAYLYQPNSNKLARVTDAVTTDNKLGDFKDGTNSGSDDYGYDANGNLTTDFNKNITANQGNIGIVYNHLNLPVMINIYGKGVIEYLYDAAGNKLKKIASEGANATTTLYVGNAVYKNDTLQFLTHEDGRMRPGLSNFNYDYFITDHLGNVRMILTEEQQQDQYPASSLEGSTAGGALSMINYEKQFYTINDNYVVNSSTMPDWNSGKDYQNNNGNPPPNSNYPAGTTPTATGISAKVYKLNATTNKTGLGMVLKVMAGDKVDIHGKSYFQSSNTYNNSNSTLLTLSDLIGAFISSPDNAGFGEKGISTGTMQTINTGLIPSGFFRGNDGSSSSAPKAYINYIFFDEQFKYAGGGFSRAGNSGTVKNHWFSDAVLQNISVPKNGYLYVYVSNESNANVFFDNLQVFHTRGPVLEENHYYPFGLAMKGISSKALNFGQPENRKKFNGIEHTTEFDLNTYDAFFRNADPQIGRWWQIDPMADALESNSPYESMGNNPISNIDPLGDFKTRFGAWLYSITHGGGKVGKNKYGEYYVPITKATIGENSHATISTEYSYGKGRNKYSASAEALKRDIEIQDDIMKNGGTMDESGNIISTGTSVYQMYDTPEEARKTTLSFSINLLLPNPFIKNSTIAINAGTNKVVNAAKGSSNLAKTPVGRSGNVLNVVTKNTPTTINGTKFTGHALDQMQARGILSPSAVLDVVKNPAKTFLGNTPGTTVFIRDNLKVVTNKAGDIITVIPQ